MPNQLLSCWENLMAEETWLKKNKASEILPCTPFQWSFQTSRFVGIVSCVKLYAIFKGETMQKLSLCIRKMRKECVVELLAVQASILLQLHSQQCHVYRTSVQTDDTCTRHNAWFSSRFLQRYILKVSFLLWTNEGRQVKIHSWKSNWNFRWLKWS